MYTAFYGLREKPFALSPDPRFLFLAQSHREALAHLLYGIEQGEGFIVITGEVGTGKTTLCRTLLQRLGGGSEVAFVFNPKLSGIELLKTINAEFGLSHESNSQRELNDVLNHFLLEKKRESRRVLLIIDEAQNLERETLEQVRLLSNLETETSKLIQIVLLGQPELDEMLQSPDLRQLEQRIGVRWRLRSLSPSETCEYVKHRLRVAAGAPCEPFSKVALRELHRLSGGVPRVVNVLADRALLAGYALRAREIGPARVRDAAAEVRGHRRRSWLPRKIARPTLIDASLAAALIVCAGLWLWLSRAPEASLRGARTDGSDPITALTPEPVATAVPAVVTTDVPSPAAATAISPSEGAPATVDVAAPPSEPGAVATGQGAGSPLSRGSASPDQIGSSPEGASLAAPSQAPSPTSAPASTEQTAPSNPAPAAPEPIHTGRETG